MGAMQSLTSMTMTFMTFKKVHTDLYDLQEGSHELMNLALGRGLRHDMRVLASQTCGQWKVQSTRTAFNFQKPRPYEHSGPPISR